MIVEEYQACAVTNAAAGEHNLITDAIRRNCHALEFAAHLQADMNGLKDYLLAKVVRYALRLESV